MASYIIAGKADSQLLAECEALAELVEEETRNIKVKTIIKYPEDWPAFSKRLCESYGFKTNACPFVFTTDGQFIGDTQAFLQHIYQKFGIKISLTREQITKRTEFNTEAINETHERLINGPTFTENLVNFMKNARTKGVTKDLGGIYKVKSVNDLKFYTKVTSALTPAPPASDKDMSEVKDTSVSFDTLDTFKDKYEAHINMIVEKRKYEEEQKKKEQEALEEQQRRAELEAQEERDESKEDAKEEKAEAKDEEGNKEIAQEGEVNPEGNENANMENAEAKEEQALEEAPAAEPLPPPIELPKPDLVPIVQERIFETKLGHDYSIVLKAENSISATELMLLPLVYDEKLEANVYQEFIVVKPRLLPQRYYIKEEDQEEPNIVEKDQVSPYLGSYFTSIYNPLRPEDWDTWMSVIGKLNAIGYLMIPPIDTKWQYKLDACIMHLMPLPNEGLNGFDAFKVPLDEAIMAQADYEKKTAEEKGEFILFNLPEYDFPHVCHLLPPKVSASGMVQIYEKCAESIDFDRETAKHGMYVLVTERWIFLSKLMRPYYNFDDCPSFLHPLAYAGVMTLPKITSKWPQTVGIDSLEDNPLKLLKHCAT